MSRPTLICLCLPLIVACAAKASSLRAVPLDVYTAQSYASGFETVADAARAAIAEIGFGIKDVYEPEIGGVVILAEKAPTPYSAGELLRVHVIENGDLTDVRVVTRRALGTNILAKSDWSAELFAAVERNLQP